MRTLYGLTGLLGAHVGLDAHAEVFRQRPLRRLLGKPPIHSSTATCGSRCIAQRTSTSRPQQTKQLQPQTARAVRPESTPTVASMFLDCHDALVDNEFIEPLSRIDSEGSLYIEGMSHHLLYKHEGAVHVLAFPYQRAPLYGRSQFADLPGGKQLVIGRSAFSGSGVIRIATQESPVPSGAVRAELIRVPKQLSPDQIDSGIPTIQAVVDDALSTLLNNVLAIPLGGAYGPVPPELLNKRDKIATVLDVCGKAAEAARHVQNEYEQNAAASVIEFIRSSLEENEKQ